jgi:sensor histidine kinase YesM
MGHSKLHATLQEELEVVEQYVHIQQFRFGGRLTADIDCSGIETDTVTIPRFTLQPLVENSIIHGLEPKVAGGMLRIKTYREAGSVIIKIIDNGAGISKEKLQSVFNRKNEERTGRTRSIGLSNVMARLAIFCGKQGGFEIKSKAGLGTVIIIRLPITKESRNV